ncbi:Slp family lipoprotein [Nitrospira defluvii]|nr:Slp family lipoprotein [Nitrospira defluvii]
MFFLSLNACAYGPKVISEELRAGITPGVTFRRVIQNPKGAIGSTVLWGGTIIETTPDQDGTRIEVLQKSLGRGDRPLETDESGGRFFVEAQGVFLDPAVYANGREVTIVGQITEERVALIGELEYRYPSVVSSHIHLWEERTTYRRSDFYPYRSPCWFGPYPYYIYPYYLYPERHCYAAFFWQPVHRFQKRPAPRPEGLQ